MSQASEQLDLSVLPEQAQSELLDFYLFLKQRYKREISPDTQLGRTRMKRLNALKVAAFVPLPREELHER